jgi:nitrate reductase gamma subunit
MRLISCIGMLMVIPAVGLLTIKYDPQVKKAPAVDARHHTKVKSIVYADSTQHDKVDHVDLATSVHPAVSGSSDANANPSFTK